MLREGREEREVMEEREEREVMEEREEREVREEREEREGMEENITRSRRSVARGLGPQRVDRDGVRVMETRELT